MANFFTSANDLASWVKDQTGPEKASDILISVIGDNQQDIIETCAAIHNGDENAAKVLFSVLGKHNLTEAQDSIETKEANMSDKEKMKKEAQTMRSGLYNMMPLRVCPKLPYSKGKRLISTWNCREHCLDSLAIDDDPNKIYCLETMWRRHVMDKFAREFKNDEGEWVGGYINERFHRFPDAGTPANPDVPRDHGNNMQLAHGERTRKPREHQYSYEARLEAERGVEPIFHEAKKNGTIMRLADKSGGEEDKGKEIDDQVYDMFSDMIEMKEAGLDRLDIVEKCADHYSVGVHEAARVYHGAMKQMERYDGKLYAYTAPKMTKTASEEEVKKKVVVAQASAGITGSVWAVPINHLLTGFSTNTGNKVTLEHGTVLEKTNQPNVFVVKDAPVSANFKINDFVTLDEATANMLRQPEVQVDVDTTQDMIELGGIDTNEIGLEEAAQALAKDPQATKDFIQDQDKKIGPMNQPAPENLEIGVAAEVENVMQQFANTKNDPDLTITTSFEFNIDKIN